MSKSYQPFTWGDVVPLDMLRVKDGSHWQATAVVGGRITIRSTTDGATREAEPDPAAPVEILRPVAAGAEPEWLHAAPATTATGYLGAWITALLADPDTAEQTGRDIQATARRLARLTGSDTLTLHIPGPCPNTRCGRAGRRYRRDGSDLIVCGACGLTETMDAHEERAARLLTELRRRGLRDQDQDQESATRCLATDRAGNPCGRDAIRGATMCPTHQLLTELRGEQART